VIGRQAESVSAFATTAQLVLGQEAVDAKSNETSAIPALLERLAANGTLKGALVSIDAIACNPAIAGDLTKAGADCPSRPTSRRCQTIRWARKTAPRGGSGSAQPMQAFNAPGRPRVPWP
jgi:hypothetical protein